jgi:hypothetical protein
VRSSFSVMMFPFGLCVRPDGVRGSFIEAARPGKEL